jgi:hypothetical protein
MVGMETLVIEMSPARRLLEPTRFKSIKTEADRQVWDQAMAPLRARLAAGWRLAKVELDWGGSFPLTPTRREQKAREMLACFEPCALIDVTTHTPGRGRIVCHLERDP